MPKPIHLRLRYIWKPLVKRTSRSKMRTKYAYFRATPISWSAWEIHYVGAYRNALSNP